MSTLNEYSFMYDAGFGGDLSHKHVQAPTFVEALSSFKQELPDAKILDFSGDDILVCDDCEYKDSALCFETVSGTICPKCGSHRVKQS